LNYNKTNTMRRFIVTNDKFTGQAEITYNEKGTLMRIDLSAAEMDEMHVISFKRSVPATIAALAANTGFGPSTTVIEADFIITFDMFWHRYDKKIKRHRCLPIWDKLTKTDQVKAYHGIRDYDKYLKKEAWRSKADPETYLRNKYWENEYK